MEPEQTPTPEETVTGAPAGLRSIADIVKDLSKPVAPRHLRRRKQGGKELSYIAWHDAVKYLDHYAPGWCYRVVSLEHIKEKVVLIAEISIPSLEGVITRQATGNEDDVTSSYGDPFSNAESMALRRAAAKYGLGLYLYDNK